MRFLDTNILLCAIRRARLIAFGFHRIYPLN